MSIHRLLAYFFQDCKKQFRFIKKDHGFSSLAGMLSYEQGRHIITPHYDPKAVEYPFHSTVRYERKDTFIEIVYGDYNFSLECYITYQRRYRFLLSDLIQSLPDDKKIASAPICFDQDDQHDVAPQIQHIGSLLQTIHDTLKAYAHVLFIEPTEDFLERALLLQAKKVKARIQAQYEREKESACEKAAQAFHQQDFKRVIMLFRPYKNDLAPRETDMFSLAISSLDQ